MANGAFIYLFVIIASILVSNACFSHGRQFGAFKATAVIKTIQSSEGEVIDCVDIYKQPAFSHPLLRNHILQLEPSFMNTSSTRLGREEGLIVHQAWQNHGECPEGSIPIIRISNKRTQIPFPKQFPPISSAQVQLNAIDNADYQHQWALVSKTESQAILGAHARINNWSPVANPEGGSMSQIWVAAGGDNDRNSIEAGWMVAPSTGSNDPNLFVYWTNNNYRSTGCYNLDCPGFVQTSKAIALGAKVGNVSSYGGKQYDTEFNIKLDENSKIWWLTVNGVSVGYWPSNLLPILSNSADMIGFGGEAVDRTDFTTPTQMGSGHPPTEQAGKASYLSEIKYVNSDNEEVTLAADDLDLLITSQNCYELTETETDHLVVYYGGPGCPKAAP